MSSLRAVEFFSGIGGFAEACRTLDYGKLDWQEIDIVCSFDQSAEANEVYFANFGRRPTAHNLDSIRHEHIHESDLWWLSPPCTPYSRRGKAKDMNDARAVSFLNVMQLFSKHLPKYLLLENVLGFADSQAQARLVTMLQDAGYSFKQLHICPTMFGVPMRRPRYFLLARRDGKTIGDSRIEHSDSASLSSFLETNPDPKLTLEREQMNRFGESLNVIDPKVDDAYAICFTSNYWKCMKASGSFLKNYDDTLRRFSDREILRLLGFRNTFTFPEQFSFNARWRLLGNSLDVRSVQFAMQTLLRSDATF